MASLSASSPAEGNLDMVGCGSSISSRAACVVPAAGGGGHEQAGVVEVFRESRPVVVTGTGKCTAVVGVGDKSEVGDYGAVQARGSAGSQGRDRCLSAECGFPMSRSTGRPGFLSAPSTLVRPSRSLSFQPIRAHSLVMMDSIIVQCRKKTWFAPVKTMKTVGEFRW